MGLTNDDVQALLWFAEKKLWFERGYSNKLDYGDFRPLVKYMQPAEKGSFNYAPDIKEYRSATGAQKAAPAIH
jgi:hypothetical protein